MDKIKFYDKFIYKGAGNAFTKLIKPENRVYISGPMSYIKSNNVGFFNLVRSFLCSNCGAKKIVNPAKILEGFEWLNYDEYIRVDLCLLDMCDTILMLPFWRESKGGIIELNHAKENGIRVLYMDKDFNITEVE